MAVKVAISPEISVPWADPPLFETNVGPLSRLSGSPLPSVRVSVTVTLPKVILPVFLMVIR